MSRVPWSWLELGGLGTLQAKKARAPFVPAPMLAARALVLGIGSETTGLLQSRSSSPALCKGVLPYPLGIHRPRRSPPAAVFAGAPPLRGPWSRWAECWSAGNRTQDTREFFPALGRARLKPSSSAIAPLLLERRDPRYVSGAPLQYFPDYALGPSDQLSWSAISGW